MAIQVTCPGCLKRFSVSEKFAGKTGPCPNCSKQIKIPDKSEEVVIHAPEAAGPKDSKGRSVLKPIRRAEVKLSTPVIVGASVGSALALVLAIGLGVTGTQLATPVLAVSALALAFPLVFAGYWFLRDDELEGYKGQSLWGRVAICAAVFAATWALYAYIPMYLSSYDSMAELSGLDMAIFIPVMLVVGTLVSIAVFELEVLNGLLHYALYFVVTFVLAWLAGTPLSAPLAGDSPGKPSVTTPQTPPAGQPPVPVPQQPSKPVPNLLQ